MTVVPTRIERHPCAEDDAGSRERVGKIVSVTCPAGIFNQHGRQALAATANGMVMGLSARPELTRKRIVANRQRIAISTASGRSWAEAFPKVLSGPVRLSHAEHKHRRRPFGYNRSSGAEDAG